jgi:hypothetical protein
MKILIAVGIIFAVIIVVGGGFLFYICYAIAKMEEEYQRLYGEDDLN